MKNTEYITLKEYQEFKDKIWNEDITKRAWKTLAERDALEKELSELYKRIMPTVGMGATEVLYTDRRAKTIVTVLTPNKVIVRENQTVCKDYYGSEYEILEELSNMPSEIFTRRKSGRWVAVGQPDKFGSVMLYIGERRHYIDPSF